MIIEGQLKLFWPFKSEIGFKSERRIYFWKSREYPWALSASFPTLQILRGNQFVEFATTFRKYAGYWEGR